MKVVGLPVVGVHARQPDRLLRFYRDFLGFPVVDELDVADRGIHVWYLQMGDARLKIIANQEPPTAANARGGVHAATGLRYFTLPIEGLGDVLERLVAAGGVEVRPVVTLGGTRIAMLEDPEGNCFELTEVGAS